MNITLDLRTFDLDRKHRSRHAEPTGRMPTASDLMHTRVVVLAPDADIDDALDLLVQHQISGAPVVDRQGRLQGLLSEKDCLSVLANLMLYRQPAGTVCEYMTDEVTSVPPTCELLGLASLFLNHPYHLLPVVDADDRLLGVVRRHDALRGIQQMRVPSSAYPDYRRPA